ncbi:MAG: hypothetical protein Q8Q15_01980 [bacterium]|nr:hypothetical protein [bacterium]
MQNYVIKIKKILLSSFLVRAAVLISFKETYLFFCNWYGLVYHPFKTTARILEKPDKSQTFLIFGLPAYVWFLGTIFFVPVFFLLRNHYDARILLLSLFYTFTFLLFLLGCYLLYFAIVYLYRCKLKPKLFQ